MFNKYTMMHFNAYKQYIFYFVFYTSNEDALFVLTFLFSCSFPIATTVVISLMSILEIKNY